MVIVIEGLPEEPLIDVGCASTVIFGYALRV